MITGQTPSVHTEASVEILMKDQEEAAEQHSQAVIAETEKKITITTEAQEEETRKSKSK